MSRRPLDLAGRRFGRLKVLGRAGDAHGTSVWLCRCRCGRETTVRGDNLTGGNTTSCGVCPRRGPAPLKVAGKRFGLLTALRRVGTDPHGGALWLCQCECGTLVTRRAGGLTPASACGRACPRRGG